VILDLENKASTVLHKCLSDILTIYFPFTKITIEILSTQTAW